MMKRDNIHLLYDCIYFKNKFEANNIHLNDDQFINNNFENTRKALAMIQMESDKIED